MNLKNLIRFYDFLSYELKRVNGIFDLTLPVPIPDKEKKIK